MKTSSMRMEWAPASSRTTSSISAAGTSGIWIFLMISSRPQMEIVLGGFDTGAADGFLDRVGDRGGIVDRRP